MTHPIELEEAWERLFALISPLESETVHVDESLGRTLAEPVISRRNQPWANLSAMDGFATSGSGPWRIVGESRAGAPFAGHISAGEATLISTGAAMPDGSDGVLLKEDARLDGTSLLASDDPSPLHIRLAGFDFGTGESLLETGLTITPARIALIRTAGIASVTVARRPRVTIIECGDELVGDPESALAGQLPSANGAMLASMARRSGAIVEVVGPVPDDFQALVAALDAAKQADCIITIGGASVGDHDLVKPALEEVGATLDFWRVAIRPGKPLLVGKRGEQIVMGLPGNPASAFVTGFLFALPAIRAMQGVTHAKPTSIALPLAGNLPAGGPRREFRRAVSTPKGAMPLDERDSSALRALAQADLLIERHIGCDETKTGTPVPCYWLRNG